MRDRQEFVKVLLHGLRSTDLKARVSNRMDFPAVPWTTTATFNGTAVLDYFIPTVEGGGRGTEAILDMWVAKEQDPCSLGLSDLGFPDVEKFLKHYTRLKEEEVVLLLWLLSRADGASMTYDETSMWVTHEEVRYGIENGVVSSRFSSGFKATSASPKAVLESRRSFRTYDPTFIAMYREAYDKGNGLLEALVSLRVADPSFNFRKAMKLCKASKVPPPSTLKRAEDALSDMSVTDPISRVFKMLVPQWATATEFQRAVCAIGKRPDAPDFSTRQTYINKMYHHFHTKETEQ